ncbi:MAG: hypothetical protein EBY83_02970 [Verrucomicrobia bacterium]|nr:hypothetical protein [Verrucomicrobiota bacterium]
MALPSRRRDGRPARTKANHATVPTSEVNRLREIDLAARKAASAKAPTKAKAEQVVEIAPPASVETRVDAMEVMLARIVAHIGA